MNKTGNYLTLPELKGFEWKTVNIDKDGAQFYRNMSVLGFLQTILAALRRKYPQMLCILPFFMFSFLVAMLFSWFMKHV